MRMLDASCYKRLPSLRPGSLSAILLCSITALTIACAGQSAETAAPAADYKSHAVAIPPAPEDPNISRALATIDAAHVRQTVETLVGFGTRSTLSSVETDLPPNTGVTAAADWIFERFEEISTQCGGCLEVKRDTFINPVAERIRKPTTITNVYAILKGTDPVQRKRMYLVTGHYDSRNSDTLDDHGKAPGANDDATGVAVSIECARVLSKLKLPASIVFVAVAGEEQGLNGSAHLAHLARTENWDLQAVLNNNIVGGNTTPGDTLQRKDAVRVFSEGFPAGATPEQLRKIRALGSVDDAPSRQLARTIVDVARTYMTKDQFAPFIVSRPDRYLRGGDHTSFNKEGFSAVRITEWREDFNHQHQDVRIENGVQFGDLLQFVDFGYVAEVAKLNAATLATLAAAPCMPADFKIVATKLENGTTLSWKAPAGAPTGFHYELTWRETTASDWQFSQAVPPVSGTDAVSITVPISKDNVIFGVRAVDAAGHRGLIVTP